MPQYLLPVVFNDAGDAAGNNDETSYVGTEYDSEHDHDDPRRRDR